MPQNPEKQFIANSGSKATIRLQRFLDTYQYERAEEYYKNIKEPVDPIWYEEAVRNARQKEYNGLANVAISSVQSLLNDYEFEKAEEYFNKNAKYINAELYKDAYRVAVQRRRQNEINAVKSKLEKLVDSYRYHEAKDYYEQNKNHIDETWYEEICRFAREKQFKEKAKDVKSDLQKLLESFRFDDVKEYCQANKEYVDTKWYEDAYRNAEQQQFEEKVKVVKLELQELLDSYRFDDAKECCQINKDYIDSAWYGKWENYYYQKYKIEGLLQKHHYSEADNLYKEQSECFKKEEYISKKAEQIQIYSKAILDLDNQLDSQQSLALADISDNMLVTARAGSGKTTVLTCKGMLLAASKYVDNQDSILMLAFNRKAADEIRERINIKHKMPLKNIRTFHSLSHRIVQPTQEIKEDYEREMADHLKMLLQDDSQLKPLLYEFFKKEMEDINYRGLLLNETEYYSHAKDYWQSISLGGDRVKSYGEKCIADFLFEHGLTYKYEKPYLRQHVDGSLIIYKPDFAIYDSKSQNTFILEHWAIPDKANYRSTNIWSCNDKTEYQYADEREKKRKYWNCNYWHNRGHYLLETDISWLANGRDEFEKRLKYLFESKDIKCNKLPEKDRLDKVYRNHSNKLFSLFVSFIQKCRRNGYVPESIKKKRDEYATNNEKEKVFLSIAPEIYEKYENNLDNKNKLDFDRLINLSIDKIRADRGECCICDTKNNVNIKVKDLTHILIDEFQDFSTPFYNIVTAIKEINPDVKLFCVGDDWQAINGFAGSDLKYYYEFESHYSGTSKRLIQTNYRSGSRIVNAGNHLMNGLGERSTCSPSNNKDDEVQIVNIEDYHIEARSKQDGTEQYADDKKYIQACEIKIPNKDGGEWRFPDYDTARYLKAIHCKIKQNIELLSQEDKKCFVLTRTNRFGCFPSTEQFKEKLLEVFSNEEKNRIGRNRIEEIIHVLTAHKSKGKEADIVFVLKCNLRSFPMVHPDNRLFEIFGDTEEKVLAEEKRLFYVALTRAKKKVYLLTEADDKSPFLDGVRCESEYDQIFF